MLRVCLKLKRLKGALRDMNSKFYSNISRKIAKAREDLDKIQPELYANPKKEQELLRTCADLSYAEAPASEIQDRILFTINNLSASDIEAKAKEFTEILKEQYNPWFAQYMVMKRASIEPNFHDLYLKFIEKINSKPLNKEIVQATYENCKVLLGSELIKSSSEERSLLKNQGMHCREDDEMTLKVMGIYECRC
ncbi:hypothetical protein F0562_027667 [Nyssa sinensis]|uniref:CCR4-NOT transcription complex subunit 1 CAF1-binding domain-containing protein n=1 Tax=Nyssa sinensis TaxID=561372 RepID=A0A5J5B5E8_9ASTE|nr:hypothetical protein F0562_027667 [Nyssa sinensis]